MRDSTQRRGARRAGIATPASARDRRSGMVTRDRVDGTGDRAESIATRVSRTRMRSRRATHKGASGSSNDASDLPITVDPVSIALNKSALNRSTRPDNNGIRADRGSIDLNRSAHLERSGIRPDRSRNRDRIAANDDRRVARSPIGPAHVGSKRRRSGPENADGSCVITHVVLLRPRADLSADERTGIVDAFRTAVRTIPSIRRVRLGKRVKHGRQYEQSMGVGYEFAALLDFDDVEGLQAYLEHPAHAALATRFFQVLDEALMYDFELDEGEAGLEKLA